MELRKELTPPVLDEHLVSLLATLADSLDGNPSEELRQQFNNLAGTDLSMDRFQGVYESEDHANFVRGILRSQLIRPLPNVTQDELIEVVRRAMIAKNPGIQKAYMAIFDCNVPLRQASSLIFYPPDYDEVNNTWSGGKPMNQYDPSAEQIVKWAFDSSIIQRWPK